jgi:hypothetical protein
VRAVALLTLFVICIIHSIISLLFQFFSSYSEELKKQLKIHLGVIPDDSVAVDGFDPSEFSPSASSLASRSSKEETLDSVSSKNEDKESAIKDLTSDENVETNVQTKVEEKEESLIDEDFLEDIRKM